MFSLRSETSSPTSGETFGPMAAQRSEQSLEHLRFGPARVDQGDRPALGVTRLPGRFQEGLERTSNALVKRELRALHAVVSAATCGACEALGHRQRQQQ